MNIEQRIQKQIDGLVREVVLIAQEAALATVSKAFAGGPLAQKRSQRVIHGANGTTKKRSFAKKRDAEEIEALAEKFSAAVSENPGETMATLSKSVGSSPRELIVPVRRLLDGGQIRAVGERNLRRYFPGATLASTILTGDQPEMEH